VNSRKNEQLTNHIRMHLAEIISREVSDPRLADIVIGRIELASDGSFARIFISTFTGGPESGPEIIKVLKKASGYIRRLLSRKLMIRTVPELRFRWDDSVKEGEQVLSLLRSLKKQED